MVEITIFELNLESVDLTANAPFSAAESPEDIEAESDESGRGLPFSFGRKSATAADAGGDDDVEDVDVVAADEDDGSGPLPKVAALGLVVLAVVVGRRLMGGESEPLPEEDEAVAPRP